MRTHALACLAIAALATSACSSSSSGACSAQGTVTATVTNQVDSENDFVCNATVTITPEAGGAAKTLAPQGLDGSTENCIYVINVGPGSYTLKATAEGYQDGSIPIAIQQVACVTASASFAVSLIPTAGGPSDDTGSDDSGSDDDASVIRDGAVPGE